MVQLDIERLSAMSVRRVRHRLLLRRTIAIGPWRVLGSRLVASGLVVALVLTGCAPWKGTNSQRGAATEPTSVSSAVIQDVVVASVAATSVPPTVSAPLASPIDSATESRSSAASSKGQTPVPTVVSLSAIQLAADVDALVESVSAHVAVEIVLADGTTLYQREPESLFDAASLYKLGIMVEVFRERDAGLLSFDDPITLYPGFFVEDDSVYDAGMDVYSSPSVGELLTNMITLSSNVAAQALLNLVGADQVNATMAGLGLTNTRILWSPVADAGSGSPISSEPLKADHSVDLVAILARSFVPGSKVSPVSSAVDAYDVTTAADMAHFFEELLAGTVVSQRTSAEMLTLLSKQQISDRIPADLPSGTRVAHKTGDLDGLLHDAGVIYAPKGPVIVVVMCDEITDYDATIGLIRQIALLAYEFEH